MPCTLLFISQTYQNILVARKAGSVDIVQWMAEKWRDEMLIKWSVRYR